MSKIRKTALSACAVAALSVSAPASAALTLFDSWVGAYGLSTDGGGSTSGTYDLSAFVPVGATVTAAYLYQATLNFQTAPVDLTFEGSSVTWDTFVANPTYDAGRLGMARADVTSLVAPTVNGGLTGTYNFTVDELGNTFDIDGTVLAVIYTMAGLPDSTVALLDGFSALGGDSTSLNFSQPLDPTAPGFEADMRLGIGFSCCDQASNVSVNGTLITSEAGNNDDGAQVQNGSLITMGGNDDPFSPHLPTYENDHERYDLTPYITLGDTTIQINTNNPSNNDNIFLAAFQVSGEAGVNAPPPNGAIPEPATWAMMLMGFGAVGFSIRRSRKKLAVEALA